ncbi:MAG TPA: HmuY family protein [Longimicrobiaceae bacterium]|nr:HmuY family protein [Longimicrobiaceae bacterium]
MLLLNRFATGLFPVVAVLALAGCSESSTGPEKPDPEPIRTITVDAAEAWAYADLQGDTAALVAVADPTSSAAWDIGFFKTAVQLNGGASGPGDMVAVCLCQNADATDAEVQQLTAATELADFEAVTAADIPAAGAAWTSDVFETAPWYRYDLAGNHQIWPTFEVYLLRRGDEVYKIQLIGYYGPAGETRQITFRYAQLAG